MFRFTIRDVLWLTVVADMACAWLLDHRRASDAYNRLLHKDEWKPAFGETYYPVFPPSYDPDGFTLTLDPATRP